MECHVWISSLNGLLKFEGETFLPQIRTIRKAATDLKCSESEFGVAESHIGGALPTGK